MFVSEIGNPTMKVLSALIFLALLCPPQAFAAKCKVGGQWFSYDSPECNPDRIQHEGKSEQPGDDSEPLLPDHPSTPVYSLPVNLPAYKRPWRQISYEVEQRCGKYKSRALEPSRCRLQEESSYWAMKSNFGLPESIALEVKAYCAEKFPSFYRQSRCTEQEATGYFVLTLDYAMPANYRGEAKAKCLKEHSTYAERGRCMTSEETAFAEKYGHQFYEPRKVGRRWTNPRQPLVSTRASFSSGPTWTEIVGQFEANPEHLAPAQLALNRSDPPFRLPLTTAGIQLGVIPSDTPLNGIPVDQGDLLRKTMAESTDRFSLSLQEPNVENRGFLELVAPSTVDPRRGAFFTTGSAGQVVLHLYIEQGRTYFVDFRVNSWEEARFRVTAESSDQVYEYAQDNCCHVLAKVKAKSLGWTRLTLTQDAGPGFYLHAIDVTFTPRSEWTPESVPADGS
jgi:hypothetical protein